MQFCCTPNKRSILRAHTHTYANKQEIPNQVYSLNQNWRTYTHIMAGCLQGIQAAINPKSNSQLKQKLENLCAHNGRLMGSTSNAFSLAQLHSQCYIAMHPWKQLQVANREPPKTGSRMILIPTKCQPPQAILMPSLTIV
jgi:hypothetical protein